MFREEPLYRQLMDPDNRAFMKQFGYTEDMTMDEMLVYAAKRFREYKAGKADFPHEMGIFLGYPLGDVKGFIEHHGRNCLCKTNCHGYGQTGHGFWNGRTISICIIRAVIHRF